MAVTINGSTGISGVDGSAGTPALIGSDADTGIFLAAGQVSASVNGTAGNVPLVSGTAQNSTSGTSIDFTGIPSWVKRVTVMFNGVSTNGTSRVQIQIGAGSFTTSGYVSQFALVSNASSTIAGRAGSGFIVSVNDTAADIRYGNISLCSSGANTWIVSGVVGVANADNASFVSGGLALGGTLDRVRITTVNGTDTFDAGSINIMYE